ncbi:MAG: redoxin domain-containing protein [Chitinophagaceae bacterium]
MKKAFLLIVTILSMGFAQAQEYDSVPPYLKNKELPSFNLLQEDSSWFRPKDLPKNQPTVIIYFNPDCGHCQETAKKISENMADFQNVTFLWVTYLSPLDEIATFQKDFKLDLPNVHFGKDPQYYIPSFFRVEQTPFVALYDANGKLAKAWPMYFRTEELKKVLEKGGK